ncbi:hypothetical protein, partial [Streptomyces panaciradicis]|uniref:hypothetical protein n=1 Tax=Streptomyces panaciradicis TaxID=1470261 RepID=UPI00201CBC72
MWLTSVERSLPGKLALAAAGAGLTETPLLPDFVSAAGSALTASHWAAAGIEAGSMPAAARPAGAVSA